MHGSRLKEERSRLGLTQPQVAERCGIGKTTVINWEKDASSPSAPQLSALSGLGVDVMYVLTGKRSGGMEESIERSMNAAGISDGSTVQQISDLGKTLGVTDNEALNVVRETAAHYGLEFSEAIDASLQLANKTSGMPGVLASLSKDDLTNDERELLELYRAAPLKLKAQAVSLLDSAESQGGSGVSVTGNNNATAGRDLRK